MNINFPQFGLLDDQVYRNHRVMEIAKFLRELSGQRRRIPFDPFLCASYFGIGIRERQLPAGISGRLRVNDSMPEIEVNCADQRLRKRYTVCHELAHLCFQKEIPATPKERADIDWADLVPTVQRREEVLCNQIAAELLMPANPFRRMAKSLCSNFFGLSALASAFDVSISACLRRVETFAVWSVGTREWQIQKGRVIARRWPKPTVASRIRRSREIAQVKSQMYRLLSQTEHIIKNKYGAECTSYEKCPRGYQHALINGSEIHIARFQNVINAFVIIR